MRICNIWAMACFLLPFPTPCYVIKSVYGHSTVASGIRPHSSTQPYCMMKILPQATKNTRILITPVSAYLQVEVPYGERQAEETRSYLPPCLAPAGDITLAEAGHYHCVYLLDSSTEVLPGKKQMRRMKSFSVLNQGNFIWS